MNTTVEDIRRLSEGTTLVFTNGVFDILHVGHVDYLERARALGDMLVVALNTDESVRRLGKGPGRPVNTLSDRMRVVGALRCVDFVTSFGEDTPETLIADLKPNIHVKGGDYRAIDLPETKTVEAYGGRVVILPFVDGKSTTNVLDRLLNPSAD